MANNKTLSTNKLIHSIKLRAAIPETQNTFQEEDFLYFINEEMDLGVVPHILQYHEDYFLFTERITLIAGVNRYQIPNRAIGNKLRDVSFSDGANQFEMTRISVEDVSDNYFNGFMGNSSMRAFFIEGDEVVVSANIATNQGFLIFSYYARPNTLVSEDNVSIVTKVNRNNGLVTVDKAPLTFASATNFDITSSKSSFRLVSKEIVPDGLASDLNLNFTFGKSQLIEYTLPLFTSIVSSSYITVIDNSAGQNTKNVFWFDKTGTAAPVVPNANIYRVNCLAAVDNNAIITILSNLFNNTFVDSHLIMVQTSTTAFSIQNGGVGISVGNNFSLTATLVVITQIILQLGEITIPIRLQINDVVALPEETIIPQIPIELHAMLAQRAAMRCLESLGDTAGLQAAAAKLADMETKTGNLIDNRVESSPMKIVPRHGTLRRTNNSSRW